LEHVDWNWVVSGSNYGLKGTAHIDLYNPDTGLGAMAEYSFVDGIWGHIVDALGDLLVVLAGTV